VFDADSAIFGMEAHEPTPSVAGNTLFGDLKAFVESYGADKFFSQPEQVPAEDPVADGSQAEAFELFEVPAADGMMRVPTEDEECSASRERRLAACKGLGTGKFNQFFKASQELISEHAKEAKPVASDYNAVADAIAQVKALSTEHSAETVQQACKLLENIQMQLRGTQDTGVSIHCLDIYKQFAPLVDKLAQWEWFQYDRRSDSFSAKYEAAYRNVERLMGNLKKQGEANASKLEPSEVKQCQEGAKALGPLLQDYADLWQRLGRYDVLRAHTRDLMYPQILGMQIATLATVTVQVHVDHLKVKLIC
jgi:hypothetical protein